MDPVVVEIESDVAATLRELAEAQGRSEAEVMRDALALYARETRPLPRGMGKYRSGHKDTSVNTRALLREAARDGRWP